MNNTENHSTDFIRSIIKEDIKSGKHNRITTRFPPEPNGYIHIGHATAVCLNFGIAQENENSSCNLRFDDTNPSKENKEFVEATKNDIKWLGFDYGETELYASDHFETLYQYAVSLVKKEKAYVDSLNAKDIRTYRGTLTEAGKNSPYRGRTIQENLDLLSDMRDGKYLEGTHVLRAKIDMSSPNMNMRDPVMYRIIDAVHHQTGDKWPIYPMYDFAHGLCDSIEGITHSLCTMEYEDHRPLYEWFIKELNVFPSRQIEFGKVLLSHTILSKRNLLRLVEGNYVDGWDDPRMPTISGMRRLGYTPESIRDFCERVGTTRRENVADIALLEHCLREDLNNKTERRMAVLNPIKVVIENYPTDKEEWLPAINNPQDESAGSRDIPFSRELFIEHDDFMENPTGKFFRLAPGREVRLRYGYFIKCHEVVNDPLTGDPIEIRCTYDPETKGGASPEGRKVKATIHWVSTQHAIQGEVRLYDRLCIDPTPDISADSNLESVLNPNSLKIIQNARLEPSLRNAKSGERFQFERLGYFCSDTKISDNEIPVFNRTVTLRDTWKKVNNSNPRS